MNQSVEDMARLNAPKANADVLDQMLADAGYYREWFAHALSDEQCRKREKWLDRVREYEAQQIREQLIKYPSAEGERA